MVIIKKGFHLIATTSIALSLNVWYFLLLQVHTTRQLLGQFVPFLHTVPPVTHDDGPVLYSLENPPRYKIEDLFDVLTGTRGGLKVIDLVSTGESFRIAFENLSLSIKVRLVANKEEDGLVRFRGLSNVLHPAGYFSKWVLVCYVEYQEGTDCIAEIRASDGSETLLAGRVP